MFEITAYLGKGESVTLVFEKQMTASDLKRLIGADDIVERLVLPKTNPNEDNIIIGPSLNNDFLGKVMSYQIWNYDKNKIKQFIKERARAV